MASLPRSDRMLFVYLGEEEGESGGRNWSQGVQDF